MVEWCGRIANLPSEKVVQNTDNARANACNIGNVAQLHCTALAGSRGLLARVRGRDGGSERWGDGGSSSESEDDRGGTHLD